MARKAVRSTSAAGWSCLRTRPSPRRPCWTDGLPVAGISSSDHTNCIRPTTIEYIPWIILLHSSATGGGHLADLMLLVLVLHCSRAIYISLWITRKIPTFFHDATWLKVKLLPHFRNDLSASMTHITLALLLLDCSSKVKSEEQEIYLNPVPLHFQHGVPSFSTVPGGGSCLKADNFDFLRLTSPLARLPSPVQIPLLHP